MSDQALIVFGKNPVPGTVKTRLAIELGEAASARLYEAFLLDTLACHADCDADIRLYLGPSTEKIVPGLIDMDTPFLRQKGATLGERMERAFEETFRAGYSRVVIMGSDHPTLPSSRITEAFQALEIPGKTVIGPSDDGGYYLLGLSEPAPSLFAGMTYSHDRVLEDTLSRIGDPARSAVLLEPWYDIDTMADVRRLVGDPRLDSPTCSRTLACLASIGLIENASLVSRKRFRKTVPSVATTNPNTSRMIDETSLPEQHSLSTSTGNLITLEQFIINRQGDFRHATGELTRLLYDISLAAKIVNRDVNKAGLVDIFGNTGNENVHGEIQKKLDLLAHHEFVRALRRGGECCLIGSEEHEEAIPLSTSGEGSGKYIVLLDPLDGSSNIDVNVSIGTIFSIYRAPDGVSDPSMEEALQPGINQVAAGYVIYGSSAMLVYTTGSGVNGFTLDPSIGEFILSHRSIQIPKRGIIYSINEGNYNSWELGLKQYIKWLQQEDPPTNRPYTARYIGSLVADFHRNLLKGGIYIYPANSRSPTGKIRLMYEANPMAFLVEQAGGLALDGHGRIMEIVPKMLHERTPVYIGSPDMVTTANEFLTGARDLVE